MEDENENNRMMSDEERRALAIEILNTSLSELTGKRPDVFFGIEREAGGELAPLYGGTSPEGHGSFFCEYMALEAVQTLIAYCEQLYDKRDARLKGGRVQEVTSMASLAVRSLLINVRWNLCEAFTEAFLEAQLMASAVDASVTVHVGTGVMQHIGKEIDFDFFADARKAIEEEGKRVADKKRDHLRELLGRLSELVAETPRGPKRRVTLNTIRRTRDKLRAAEQSASVSDIAVELGCDDSTIYKLLKTENKTLDEL